ncbi:MAG: hypothetical protein GC192_19815 [Bacteroidetes bacterium]|nr:hypothetical protein [Bacteroidota bacterium]
MAKNGKTMILPILITDSKLIQITEDNQLTNLEIIATFLWDVVENKEKYKRIRIGFAQSSKNVIAEETNING